MLKAVFHCDLCNKEVPTDAFKPNSSFQEYGYWLSYRELDVCIDGLVDYPDGWQAFLEEDGKVVLLCPECLKARG